MVETVSETATTQVDRAQNWKERFEQIAAEVCERESVQLYDWELSGVGGSRTLRVCIDKAQSTVGIEDCSNVSKGLNLLLDVEDLVPGGSYHLEVSSPGLERVLKRKAHFGASLGKKAAIKTFAPGADWLTASATSTVAIGESAEWRALMKAKTFEGQILAVGSSVEEASEAESADSEAYSVTLRLVSGLEIRIPRQHIAKANLVFEMNGNNGKRK